MNGRIGRAAGYLHAAAYSTVFHALGVGNGIMSSLRTVHLYAGPELKQTQKENVTLWFCPAYHTDGRHKTKFFSAQPTQHPNRRRRVSERSSPSKGNCARRPFVVRLPRPATPARLCRLSAVQVGGLVRLAQVDPGLRLFCLQGVALVFAPWDNAASRTAAT